MTEKHPIDTLSRKLDIFKQALAPTRKKHAILAIGGTAAISILAGCDTGAIPSDYGAPNFDVSSLTLHDGARLREGPMVSQLSDNDGLLHTVELKNESDTVTIQTPGGVFEHYDSANGLFYGIELDAIKIPDSLSDISVDSDGIVWVSEQKADEILRPKTNS